jgi:hypothetical protein
VALDDEVLDPEAREEKRQRQPDEAAADDQDRDLFVLADLATLYSQTGQFQCDYTPGPGSRDAAAGRRDRD